MYACIKSMTCTPQKEKKTNKQTNKKHHTVGIVPKSNRKIIERGKINTHNTQIHDLVQAIQYTVTGLN